MVKDGASNTDDISKHDLELLVHANTETQKMFGDVLHAFELFTTQQRGSVQGAKALLTDIKALTQELKDTINTHETRCVMCSDCVVKIKQSCHQEQGLQPKKEYSADLVGPYKFGS